MHSDKNLVFHTIIVFIENLQFDRGIYVGSLFNPYHNL